MKLCISKIHLGRYRLEILDDNNQVVNGTDGGSALIMMWVTDWIFKDEHAQYQIDQRRSSDEIGAAAIEDLYSTASVAERNALLELERKRAERHRKALQDFINPKANR